MNDLLQNIYYKLPLPLQNLAVSLYGVNNYYKNYGGLYSKYLAESCRRLSFSCTQMDAYADSEFVRIFRQAILKVPYYREAFKQRGISIEDIRSVGDIQKLPLLEKSVVRHSPELLVNEDYTIGKLLCVHTTGSTGTPLRIYCTPDVRRKNYATYDRFLKLAGRRSGYKRATLGGRIVVPSWIKEAPFWRYNKVQQNLLFSSYHLAPEFIPAYIKELSRYRPDYIDAYPSSIYLIADYAQKNNISLLGMTRFITTSGETLLEKQRETIESVFGVNVYDQYGSAEMCVFIGQCRHGSYHVNTDFGVVELIRDDGSIAQEGDEGEVVCTGFINEVMPLIRYRIGDRAIAGGARCECGSPFPTITEIIGRNDDVIVTPEGRRVGRLSPVLKGFPIKEAQYVQREVAKVVVRLETDEGFFAALEDKIEVELRKRLGPTIEIEFEYVAHIERSRGAKFKSIVSEISL